MKRTYLPKINIYDIDGCIINSEPYHLKAYNKALKSLGVSIPKGLWKSKYIGHDENYIHKAIQEDFGVNYNIEEMTRKRIEAFKELIKDADLKCPEKIKEAISEEKTQHLFLTSQEEDLGWFEIKKAFDVKDGSVFLDTKFLSVKNKPFSKKDVLKIILDLYEPSNIKIFEDSADMLQFAKSKNIKTIGVKTEFNKENITKEIADEIIEDFVR